MFTLAGTPLRPLVWPMPKSLRRLCSVFKNVSTSHHSSFASDSSSLSDVKRKYSAEIDQLSASITEFCSKSFKRNRKLHDRIRPVVADLERAVCASGGRSRLVLIGSIPSGMAFDESADINLAFFYVGDTQQQRELFMQDFCATSPGFVREFMEAIAVALKNFYDANPSPYRMVRRPSVVSDTRVLAVSGRLDNGARFEIQFPRADFQSVRNTLMVRYYVQADRRFLLLFHWLRRVFKEMRLTNSGMGFFSSYHMLLLVLHFLSRKEVPDNVLPAFVDFPAQMRDQMFAPDVANIVRDLDEPPSSKQLPFWTSKCAKSVGELAVELVDYYALFDPLTTAISIQHGLTDKKDAKLKDRPKLNVYDPFQSASVTRSSHLGEALVLAFQFLRGQITNGKHLTTFPLLDGLAEEFAIHARHRGICWADHLKKVGLYTPTGKFEQSPREQQEGIGFKQSPEEQQEGVMEGEMKDSEFEQSPEEQQEGVVEWEEKNSGFEQSLREMKDSGFEQSPEEQQEGVMEGEMKDIGFEQSPEEQQEGVMEREMKDSGFEQSTEEQQEGVMEGEMKDSEFEQSTEEQQEGVMEGEMKDSESEQSLREMKYSGFEQSPEEQQEGVMEGEMKGGGVA
uniref:PAP-associated domain-containing protein n=1 Tax=Globodera rostochiensis TaxID=31243 RepID=A0A914HCU4_GLORO